jgi:general secretion pathway protein D
MLFRAYLLISLVLLSTNAFAQQPETRKVEDNKVSLNFNNVEIRDLVKTMSELTGKNFLLDEKIRGRITIISPSKVSVDEAYKVFETILAVNDLTIVEAGMVTMIIPTRDAKSSTIKTVIGKGYLPRSDTFVTRLIPLKYINASNITQALRGLVSKFGTISVYQPTNTLIMIDSAANINRLLKIIRELDIDIYGEKIEVIPLENALASEIARIITSLYAGVRSTTAKARARARRSRRRRKKTVVGIAGARPSVSKVIPYERTNSLIVVANQEMIEELRELIAELDVRVPAGTGNIRVHYLQNSDAEQLSGVLSSLAAGGGARAAPGKPGAPAKAGVAQFEGGVKITADPATNSLIIISSPQDYETLKEVIEKLDIPRRQVYVEAMIVEMLLRKSRELGLEFRSTNVTEEGLAEAGMEFGGGTNLGAGINAASMNPPAGFFGLSGLAVAAFEGAITFGGETFLNIGAFFRALQSDTDVNVLSTPNLLTMDNEEAEITVGSNVPFPTGQQIGSAGITTSAIQREDVGIKLKITPQINESDFIRMNIATEISEVSESPVEGLDPNVVGLTTSKRAAQTVVVVKDRQAVVIGGLIKDVVNDAEAKVPILGDIPIIGWLFRYNKHRVEKVNLLIFLTPYIIRDSEDMEQIQMMKEEQSERFELDSFGYQEKREYMKMDLRPEAGEDGLTN